MRQRQGEQCWRRMGAVEGREKLGKNFLLTKTVKGGMNAGVSQTISCHILPYVAAFPSQTRLLYLAIRLPCASLTLAPPTSLQSALE